MTLRFYLANVAAPYTPATKRAAWDKATQTLARYLAPYPQGTATTVNVTPGSITAAWDVLWGVWVSDPAVAAGTLAGTVQWMAGALEGNAAANAFWHVHIYVTTGDSDTPRGTILTDSVGATEFGITAAGLTEGTKALTSLAISAGDRIVVELGYRASSDTTSRSVIMNYGNTGATELTNGSTSVTTQPGWVEFSAAESMWTSPLATLVDDFDDNSIGAPWVANSYGGISETGGRGRIPTVAATYAGYETAWVYSLLSSSVYAQVPTVPAASTATAAYIDMLILSGTDGTQLATAFDAVAGTITFSSQVGFTDAAQVVLTYSPSAHAWWRIRHSSGTVFWDTAPDGINWTNQKSVAAPAWLGYRAVALLFESERDAGTTDFAEIDNVNTTPGTPRPFVAVQAAVMRAASW